mgnify:FL=1
MIADSPDSPWSVIQSGALRDEAALVADLIHQAALPTAARAAISAQGADLVTRIRQAARPGMMEVFLAVRSIVRA